ncbi:MAG: hypothetical protein IKN54_05930 [Lachnospiraceae bacterium]|nr:hypothetical protein [Lachnospiraceae bacterium]
MKKRSLIIAGVLIFSMSLVGCDVELPEFFDRFATEEDSDDDDKKESKYGYDTSDEVIKAFWKAYEDCDKEGFRMCFVDEKSAKKDGTTNTDDLVDNSYESAVKLKETVEFNLEEMTIESESCEKDIVKEEILEAFDIDEVVKSKVVVPLKQKIDGTVYNVNDEYEIITVLIDKKWYINDIKEKDARIVDETNTEPESNQEEITTASQQINDDDAYANCDKIEWGVSYALADDLPEFKASVSMYMEYDVPHILVALTNKYDKPITISGKASAKDSNGNIIGDTFIYFECIEACNTVLFDIPCYDGIPNGEIKWEEMEIEVADKESVQWNADWKLSPVSDTELQLDYELTFNGETPTTVDNIMGVLIDEKGLIVAVLTEGDFDLETGKGVLKVSDVDISSYKSLDVAFFANAYK